jgi:predicted lipid-binding transport protein (Tim44 family)
MRKKLAITAIAAVIFLIVTDFAVNVEARAPSGGRSISRSPSMSRPSSPPPPPPPRQYAPDSSFRPSNPMGGSFARGVAGGLLGGFIGNMLFGGSAHGMGVGGVGGSGVGLFELLILGGIGFFLYKRFSGRGGGSLFNGFGQNSSGNPVDRMFSSGAGAAPPPPPLSASPDEDPLVIGVREIWSVDDSFHPDRFKEAAQDLFFKIQAGWTRRDPAVIKDLVGDQLLSEYNRHFEDMKQKGVINRLENIAVRQIDLISAGVQNGEKFVSVKFIANLLDYTVEEKTGAVVFGDNQNPIKFEETWTFACAVGGQNWKLEGIEA